MSRLLSQARTRHRPRCGRCGCLETTALALAPEQPDVTATLHGAVDHLVPNLAHVEPYRALRKRAIEATNTQLGAARVSELHARGTAMTEEQASAYALQAIDRFFNHAG